MRKTDYFHLVNMALYQEKKNKREKWSSMLGFLCEESNDLMRTRLGYLNLFFFHEQGTFLIAFLLSYIEASLFTIYLNINGIAYQQMTYECIYQRRCTIMQSHTIDSSTIHEHNSIYFNNKTHWTFIQRKIKGTKKILWQAQACGKGCSS